MLGMQSFGVVSYLFVVEERTKGSPSNATERPLPKDSAGCNLGRVGKARTVEMVGFDQDLEDFN